MLAFLLRTIGYLILIALSFIPAGVVHFLLKSDIPAAPKDSFIFNLPYLNYEVIYAHLRMDVYGKAYLLTLAYIILVWLAVSWIRLRRKEV